MKVELLCYTAQRQNESKFKIYQMCIPQDDGSIFVLTLDSRQNKVNAKFVEESVFVPLGVPLGTVDFDESLIDYFVDFARKKDEAEGKLLALFQQVVH